MTTLNTILMLIGFGLWFWAGYKVGYGKCLRENLRRRRQVFNTKAEMQRKISELGEVLESLKKSP